MSNRLRVASLLALAVACGPVHKQVRPQAERFGALKRLDVHFAKSGEFSVFEKRVDANAGASAMFGLIGAAIAEGVDADADRKTTELIAARLPAGIGCRPGVEKALLDALAANGKIEARLVEAPDPASGADGVLALTIEHCGFRLTNQSSGEMSAFVEIDVKLTLAGGSVVWDDRETVIAASRATIERLKSEEGLARPLLEGVLADAGKRLAYNVLYP